MQKLIILDSETGVCTILPFMGDEYEDDLEMFIEKLGFNVSSCQWMIALEINDTTK